MAVTEPAPPPAPAPLPAEPLGGPPMGVLVALAGASMVLVSATLGWMVDPIRVAVGQEDALLLHPVQTSAVTFLFRVFREEFTPPTVAQTVVFLGLVAAGPLLLGARSRAWEVLRKVAGGLVLVVVILFVLGYQRFVGPVAPPGAPGTLGALRLGLYMAVAGALLTVAFGPSLRKTERADTIGRSPGLVLAAAGLALLALGAVMAWVDRTFIPPDVPDPGVYAVDFSLPQLLVRTAEGRVPTVGGTIMLLAVGGMFVLVASGTTSGVDLLRRGMGILCLAISALVPWRLMEIAEHSGPFDYTVVGLLRLGFLAALAGAVLTVVAGRPLRGPPT